MMGNWGQAPHVYLITKLWCYFNKTKKGSWVQAPFCQTYKCTHIIVIHISVIQTVLPSNCNTLPIIMTLILKL